MKVEDVLTAARDSLTVKRVFAEPIERDGTTVVVAAAVAGGGGGGGGTDKECQEGSVVVFGIGAKRVGAFVLKDGRVDWKPALDVNRLVLVAGRVVVAILIAGARIVRYQTTR
ncbi:sporulation protein [Nocardia seriolae]|uniref:sporulation protein n=1 Tax=Nocardia seriolae TaxID=37332 RepID=UPI0012BC5B1B|nr:sporulation protein [Nocardia seriolae]MTL15391.1 sporulation protein [Nocardia seriolae]